MKFKLTGLLLFSQAVSAVQPTQTFRAPTPFPTPRPTPEPYKSLSEPAVVQNRINKDNYQSSLCNEDLFTPTPRPAYECGNYQVGDGEFPYACAPEVPVINTHYNNYCREKSAYEIAIQDKGRQCEEDNSTYACAGNGEDMLTRDKCIEERGIRLAKACSTLRFDKNGKPNAWNNVVPTLESCNSKKLRFN